MCDNNKHHFERLFHLLLSQQEQDKQLQKYLKM